MFFLFRRPKVTVDAFTTLGHAYDFHPIRSANNFAPEWWKKTPKSYSPPPEPNKVTVSGNTIRRCAGVIEYYNKNNLIIPMWSDLAMDFGPQNWSYAFADHKSVLLHHPQEMRGEYMPEYEHFKIASPWRLQEKSGVKFHFTQAFYNFDDPAEILFPPGIVNYKYQHSTEINFFLKRTATVKRVLIEAGQPLVLLTALTDKEVEVKTHIISIEENTKRFDRLTAFHNHYIKEKKIQQQNERKCPFSFLR